MPPPSVTSNHVSGQRLHHRSSLSTVNDVTFVDPVAGVLILKIVISALIMFKLFKSIRISKNPLLHSPAIEVASNQCWNSYNCPSSEP